jgi:hypothetical protein
MTDSPEPTPPGPAAWLQSMGQAQVRLMGDALNAMSGEGGAGAQVADFWRTGLEAWGKLLTAGVGGPVEPSKDKRFKDPAWNEPPFAQIRQAYETATRQLLAGVDAVTG